MKTVNRTNGRAVGIVRHIRRLVERQGTDPLPDRQLLELFLADHDEPAFAALVRRHGSMV